MVKKYSLFVLMLFLLACSASQNNVTTPDLHSIPVELTTHLGDRQQFVDGDEIQFLLSLGRNAFIYMYYIDAEGTVTQILPNQNQRSNYYTAGYFLTIPEYDNGYRFIINKPFGEESIWVFASDQSVSPNTSSASIISIKENIRRQSRTAYGEYVLNISTRMK